MITSVPLTLSEDTILDILGDALETFGLTSDQGPVLIVRGQTNRVPEPPGPDFVVMWPLMRGRLARNIDTYFDNQFTASIANNVLTVVEPIIGMPTPGLGLYGVPVALGCRVLEPINCLPGAGATFAVSQTPDLPAQTLYCGVRSTMQETDFVAQVDVHGPSSGDNAQRISTLMWDQFAVDAFAALPGGLSPLWTSEPRQLPFVNAEQQYEDRYAVDVHLQANIAALIGQQFADRLTATSQSFG